MPHFQRYSLCIFVFLALFNMSHCKYSHHKNHHSSRQEMTIKDELGDNDVLNRDEMLAMEHSQRVAEAGACDIPKPHVIHVNDHYPGRYFLPHCTVLHRCGKHAGCCGTDRLRCVAKTKEKVTLHFYSVRISEHGDPTQRQIEKLNFYNHTQCACVPVQHASKHDL